MIAVIGGSGNLGKGIAIQLALAGKEVVIGSRKAEKGKQIASELSNQIDKKIEGTGNLEAVEKSDIIFLSIPHFAIDNMLQQIKPGLEPGNILVSVIVPLSKEGDKFALQEPKEGSAAAKIALETPEKVSVISALQIVPAKRLQTPEKSLDSDVIVCGDQPEAKEKIMKIIEKIPDARAIDGGSLSNSNLVEAAAGLLVELTRIHGGEVSIRFKGI
ncbi:hypothetical protein AKJ53_01315 [candidate division MSBL1 archaeon SCGC-AAA382F02]|uniref:Pyrroline-5-carboxylate reductase catalytic N-terminal domain-containing protein n=1 Tax=candidate division MSBL1 archaeon SCGC-AAA382F02 TaxID=1698282 RepID=A0A133VI39_9EURY|nr:hypothetical protein AKJ53_01315 [candidate division MSBL1 archaeon SCGC-AAA382F02]